jgi:hypothetical protein
MTNDEKKIITFQNYYDPMLAQIIRAKLEANGISCFLSDENMTAFNPLFDTSGGGIKLNIFEEDLEKCRAIVAEHDEIE